jgi:ribosome biogenesis protein ENP2
LAAGTAGGIVALYDVRSSRPLHVMEHKHGMPIHTVKFHPHSGCILSGDEKLVKVWRYKTSTDIVTDEQNASIGSVVVNVEGTGKFSHFILAGDEADPTGNRSGLLLCATDEPKMESFYIPSVGLHRNGVLSWKISQKSWKKGTLPKATGRERTPLSRMGKKLF